VVAAIPTGVVSFRFSDVEGSTGLWQTDTAGMAELAVGLHDEAAIVLGRAEATPFDVDSINPRGPRLEAMTGELRESLGERFDVLRAEGAAISADDCLVLARDWLIGWRRSTGSSELLLLTTRRSDLRPPDAGVRAHQGGAAFVFDFGEEFPQLAAESDEETGVFVGSCTSQHPEVRVQGQPGLPRQGSADDAPGLFGIDEVGPDVLHSVDSPAEESGLSRLDEEPKYPVSVAESCQQGAFVDEDGGEGGVVLAMRIELHLCLVGGDRWSSRDPR